MRVAMFSWESLHSVSLGGIAQHVTELAASLQRRGHEVHVFTRRAEGQPHVEEVYGVNYHRVDCVPGDNFIASMAEMCNSMVWAFGATQSRVGAFNICHAHDWMTCKALVQCKNSHGLPCIFTFHSTESGRSGGHGQDEVRALEGEAAFVADRVVAVSERLRGEVSEIYSLPDPKVWAIPNGIQCARFDGFLEDAGSVKAKYGIGPLDPVVLFVGRMVGGMKGADILAEAIPGIVGAHGGAKLVFVGDGDSKMHCDHRVNELGVAHACRFLGAKSGAELVDLFKACDCVVVPSRNEPFGLVILEAWAAGKPVVASDQVGCPVAHGHDGWVVSCTPEGLTWGVSQVFEDFARARQMGGNGRTRAAFEFSWDVVAETTEKCYASFVN